MLNDKCSRFPAALGCCTLQGLLPNLHSCPDALQAGHEAGGTFQEDLDSPREPTSTQHSLVSGCPVLPVSSATTKAPHPSVWGLSSSPCITSVLRSRLSMPSSRLMSQFRNRDAPAATWEGSGPKNI
ncbi:hypothetical protein HPG69_000140 [Diceros bicornis minor]|uniref:Uncharacterized protein n=1 Tax=Diceros bicornis minor TaxID=77932 RepID=A0A7J7EV26_DICBM|nr:hypothetical protein HPG69_000140 [Diceros bicornis minor]